MNRRASGFTLMEMLIVVTIIAVLVGVGFNYYSDSIEDARVVTVRNNLKVVRDAISRYFKDHMAYPTSLESLQGSYLMQSVTELLISPLDAQGVVLVEVLTNANHLLDPNIFHADQTKCESPWPTYDFGGVGSNNRQIRNIRIRYNGTEMNW